MSELQGLHCFILKPYVNPVEMVEKKKTSLLPVIRLLLLGLSTGGKRDTVV